MSPEERMFQTLFYLVSSLYQDDKEIVMEAVKKFQTLFYLVSFIYLIIAPMVYFCKEIIKSKFKN